MHWPAEIVFVRHAESARNVAKKGNSFFSDDESRHAVRGVADHRTPLTEEGRRQAAQTGRELFTRFGVFDHVFHSGYHRTVETATLLMTAVPSEMRERIPLTLDPFIRERDTGFAYDMTTDEAANAFPWLREYWQTSGPFFARPPGGESVAQVVERVQTFLQRLQRECARRRILVVTHGITLRALRFVLEDWDYDTAEHHLRNDPPRNCSITRYEADANGERMLLKEYNTVLWAVTPLTV